MKDVEDAEDVEDVDVRCPCQCPWAIMENWGKTGECQC